MGADTFMTTGRGKTAAEAFNSARDEAAHEQGPAGCIALGDGEWLFFGWASS